MDGAKEWTATYCFLGLSLNSCGKRKYFHICPLIISMFSNHVSTSTPPMPYFSYSYQSVFCTERCVYFDSTTFIVNSPLSSIHLFSQGRDHFSVDKVSASQLWYCPAVQTMSHFGVRRDSLQGVWVSVYQMAKAKRPFSEKWALPSHCECWGLIVIVSKWYHTHHAKGSSANLFENVIVIVHAVLCLDLNGLRDVLGVDVKHELVVVPDLALLTTDFLASFRINWTT